MTSFEKDLFKFIEFYEKNKIQEIYNEDSLKFELAYFLRQLNYKVYFEKNISNYIKHSKKEYDIFASEKYVKHEIDLVIEKGNQRYAIELKYPRNGRVTEELEDFRTDMIFMKQAKDTKQFKETYCFTWADNPLFYDSTPSKKGRPRKVENNNNYDAFRTFGIINYSNKLSKVIVSRKNNMWELALTIQWNSLNNKKLLSNDNLPIKYYLAKIISKN